MNRSENISKLTVAMVEVQKEIKGMTPNAKNPFFKSKYITLDGILEYIRPILSKSGIWLTQEAKGLEGNFSIVTTLFHISGEFIKTDSLEMTPTKLDPQTMGSTLTYQKRYQLAALMGISSDVDDDGNHSSGNKTPKEEIKDLDNITHVITKDEAKNLLAIAQTVGVTASQVTTHLLAKFKLSLPSQLNKDQYDIMCKGYENMKKVAK